MRSCPWAAFAVFRGEVLAFILFTLLLMPCAHARLVQEQTSTRRFADRSAASLTSGCLPGNCRPNKASTIRRHAKSRHRFRSRCLRFRHCISLRPGKRRTAVTQHSSLRDAEALLREKSALFKRSSGEKCCWPSVTSRDMVKVVSDSQNCVKGLRLTTGLSRAGGQ